MPSNILDSYKSIARLFHILCVLLAGIGFAMLAMASQISVWISLLFVIPYICSFNPSLVEKLQLSTRRSNLLTWAYVPFFFLDMFYLSRSFVSSTLHLILFIQVIKLYQPKKDRDYFYLIVLSFLQVLAASSLTIDTIFLVTFLCYLLVCLSTLVAFEMKRSLESSMSAENLQGLADESVQAFKGTRGNAPLKERGWATRSIWLVSIVSFLSTLMMGSILFFAIPRFGAGYFQRIVHQPLALSGFSDRVQLGGIGIIQLDSSIVMRVRVTGNARVLNRAKWRGVTLDHFDGKTWSKHLRGIPVTYTSGQEFVLNYANTRGVRVSYQVWMEPNSTGYLFTLDQIQRLQGRLAPLSKDSADDSIMTRPHAFVRLMYQGDSILSIPRDISLAELSPEARNAYLQLPGLDNRFSQLAQSITEKGRNFQEKATEIESFLRTNYVYSLEQSQLENPQPLVSFLFESKRGHCEYFASAMVVLLRVLGIPSRIVNGFQAGEFNEIGNDYVIRSRHAHSWVEAFDREKGWLAFDPTPASSQIMSQNPLFMRINNYLDAFEIFWSEWVVGYDEVIQESLFRDLQQKSDLWTALGKRWLYEKAQTAKEKAFTLSRLKMIAFLLLTGTLGGMAYLLVIWIRGKQVLKKALHRGDVRGAIQFYEEFLKLLKSRGNVKPLYLTPNEFAASFEEKGIRERVEELTGIYNAVRFGRSQVTGPQIQRAFNVLAEIKTLCKVRRISSLSHGERVARERRVRGNM